MRKYLNITSGISNQHAQLTYNVGAVLLPPNHPEFNRFISFFSDNSVENIPVNLLSAFLSWTTAFTLVRFGSSQYLIKTPNNLSQAQYQLQHMQQIFSAYIIQLDNDILNIFTNLSQEIFNYLDAMLIAGLNIYQLTDIPHAPITNLIENIYYKYEALIRFLLTAE